MKFKSILLTAAVTLSLTTATMAQVPNYVPTNGLVGWWPFNGNPNDESGNGNNGTVNGATLTSDRFGFANNSYDFNGTSNFIKINNGLLSNTFGSFSFSFWFKTNTSNIGTIISDRGSSDWSYKYCVQINNANIIGKCAIASHDGSGLSNLLYTNQNNLNQNNWVHCVGVLNSSSLVLSIYINGVLSGQISNINPNAWNNNITSTYIGKWISPFGDYDFYNGIIDDIGSWNRALTQQEITDLYNAINCANNTAITPPTNSLNTGSTATFSATTSDPNPNYIWQSNFGQGFQTLNNFGNYSGVNTATLNIANVQLPNHNQPIRVITTSGNCIDTSNVAVINIIDTCVTNITIYDTLLTTVTDTLVINATITGINPPNNQNTLKVFPNPANTHITIDYGNFNAMSGYTLTIVNSIGQTVFTTPINQQTSYIDISTWTGNGIYFVQLIDPQNNTIENRKIVIQ
jgi:hypothetical protein